MARFVEPVPEIAGAESIDRRDLSRDVIIDPFAKCMHSYVHTVLPPVALTAMFCDLFGSDETNSFYVDPALNGYNFCFRFFAQHLQSISTYIMYIRIDVESTFFHQGNPLLAFLPLHHLSPLKPGRECR
jgi:hypothetical protein